jgi:S1-C subfamily serine protease
MNRRSVSDRAHSLALLKRLVTLPLLSVSLSASPGTVGESPATTSLTSNAASAIRTASIQRTGAVVRVRGTDARGEVYGTGFAVDPSGTICTVTDLVRGTSSIVIVKDGKEYPCDILALDEGSGAAFLQTTGEMRRSGEQFLPPRATPEPPPFSPVLAIGYSGEEKPVVSLGMITGTKSHEGDCYFRVPQHLAKIPLAEGEAGAPVSDLDGHLIGMLISGNTQNGDCRILPVGAIEKLHTDLLRFGQLNPGWVGAVVEEAAVPEGNSSTRIASVEPGSPAEVAGLRAGDMILTLGNRRITQPDKLLEASFYLTAGEIIPMTLWRGGKIKHVQIQCIHPPESKPHPTNP